MTQLFHVIARTLALSLVVGLLGIPDMALAGDRPSLTVPAEEALETDASLVTDDDPRSGPDVFDVDAAGEAALDQVDLFADADWDLTALVERIGPGADSAFAFVRDRIAFDPYAGVLRGARGALFARAGNSWDRALLLRSILELQGHEARLVISELDDEAADSVVARSMQAPADPFEDPDAALLLGLDLDAVVTRARRDHALVTESLGDALGDTASNAEALRDAVRSHAWVQVRTDDGDWTDLDPTLAMSAPGESLSAEPVMLGEPAAESRHGITLRVVAETLADGVPAEAIVMNERLDATETTGQEIWLTFQPDAVGIGSQLVDVISGGTWLPVLTVAGQDRPGSSFEIGGGGEASDFLFGGGAELIGLRLELSSDSPGLEPLVSTRTLLDRVAPADRAAGSFISELLEPLPEEGQALPALAGIHQVLVSNGGADLRSHAVDRAIALGYGAKLTQDPASAEGLALHDLLYPLAVANQTLVLASERVLVDGISMASDGRAFVARPRAYLVSLVPYPEVPDGTGLLTDLALDSIDVVIPGGAEPGRQARTRLWYGMLQSALETELSLERSRAVSADTAAIRSVSLEMQTGPTLVTPDAIDGIDAGAVSLRAVLASGDIALTVGDTTPPDAFWAIDPRTGDTSSIMEPGLRIGFVGGGNYVNSAGAGPTWVVDPNTGNSLGTVRDGRFTPSGRAAPNRCGGGTEYVVVLGCVSLPASMTVGMATTAVVTAAVSWATVLLELLVLI